ncbi:T9SS type A sorting domain-containing protein [Prevotella sp. OH937_COT-195]|uniref:T9SS type A sorting domain-containing protein n=1 Tax=Prevotella sp. OH937_COT-195 TaxID=2491051 RepID=UPI000F6493D2|nr:T9SS type A sorting domain-containing protein [Prevotella sp. OH937_COT-195]RRD02942.1 T9SS C-terminal target domain-containing protein [Prevotella sp. OH937_COT-195]
MIKNILIFSIASVLMSAMPAISRAETAIEIIDNEYQSVTISVQESTLHITGANGQTVQIYNVAGVMVKSIKVEGNDRRYELNLNKGCYIVKVGKTVRKISIK